MDVHSLDSHDPVAARTTRVLSHLDGALDEQMLHAMQGVWSMLEHASADAPSHARAVRARLFWESLTPGGQAAAPVAVVTDLTERWDEASDTELPTVADGQTELEPDPVNLEPVALEPATTTVTLEPDAWLDAA